MTDELTADISIEGELFTGKEKSVREPGWNTLFESRKTGYPNTPDLPLLTLSERSLVNCHSVKIISHQTAPPDYFSDASLLSAMTTISPYIEDQDIRRTLREKESR